MKATPKRILSRFGITAYPGRYYPATRTGNGISLKIDDNVFMRVSQKDVIPSGGKPGGGAWQGGLARR